MEVSVHALRNAFRAPKRIDQDMHASFRPAALLFGLLSLASRDVLPQAVPAGQLTTSASATDSGLSEAELDQLTAPIALYADPLIGQLLTAATYPLEIVQAHRWLQDPANGALKGDQLTTALEQQSWDLSVKSLVPFPQILQMMDSNLEWTERIGDAFLAQQDAVMDSIQRLRKRASAAGALTSVPQQTVSTEDQAIQIEPANPEVVYVPYYDPNMVYGPWLWPDYPPFVFLPPDGMIIGAGLWIGFGFGFPILGSYWGWNHWDWHHHRLDIDGRRAGVRSGPWEHDPSHRRGVPYRSEAASARFQAQSESGRREARGFPTASGADGRGSSGAPREATMPRGAPTFRSAPPAFESFGARAQVRSDSARGAASRSAPAPRAAPSSHGGGSRGGGGGGGHR